MTETGIKTYEVRVSGFPPALYSARSPAKARARCWRDYLSYDDAANFRDFLKRSTIRRVPDPPGVGERVMIAGLPATTVHNYAAGHYVWFMRDDSDAVLCSHPADVTRADKPEPGETT